MAQQAPPSGAGYRPLPNEQQYYGDLFRAADSQSRGYVMGKEAVQFLSRSGLPIASLKSIWVSADTSQSNALGRDQFFLALRLIALVQAFGVAPGDPGPFRQHMGREVPLPKFDGAVNGSEGAPPQPPPSQQPPQQGRPHPIVAPPPTGIPSPQHPASLVPPAPPSPSRSPRRMPINQAPPPASLPNPTGPGAPPSNSSALASLDPYIMTATEQSRFDTLFAKFDKGDGFVYAGDAVDLFTKSGLQRSSLKEIWTLVGPTNNRLSALEFAISMHLIVCVSKKQLPMPKLLPASLEGIMNKSNKLRPKLPPKPKPVQQPPPVQAQTQVLPPPPPRAEAYGQAAPPLLPYGQAAPTALPSLGLMPPASHVQQQPGAGAPVIGLPPAPPADPTPPRFVSKQSSLSTIDDAFSDMALAQMHVVMSSSGQSDISSDPGRTMPPSPKRPSASAMGFGSNTENSGQMQPPQQGRPSDSATGTSAFNNVPMSNGGYSQNVMGANMGPNLSLSAPANQQAPDPGPAEVGMIGGFGFGDTMDLQPPLEKVETAPSLSLTTFGSVVGDGSVGSVAAPAPQTAPRIDADVSSEVSKLKQIIQQMQAEKISLTARLKFVSGEEDGQRNELNAVVSEVTSLSQELVSLRNQVNSGQHSLAEMCAEMKSMNEEKKRLVEILEETKATVLSIRETGEVMAAVRDKMVRERAAKAEQKVHAFEDGLFGGPPVQAHAAAHPPVQDPAGIQQTTGYYGGAGPMESAVPQHAPSPPVPPMQLHIGTGAAHTGANPFGGPPGPAPHTHVPHGPYAVEEPGISVQSDASAAASSVTSPIVEERRREVTMSHNRALVAEEEQRRAAQLAEEKRVAAELAHQEWLTASSQLSTKKKGLLGNKKSTKNQKAIEAAKLKADVERQAALEARTIATAAQATAMKAFREAEEKRRAQEQSEIEAATQASMDEKQRTEDLRLAVEERKREEERMRHVIAAVEAPSKPDTSFSSALLSRVHTAGSASENGAAPPVPEQHPGAVGGGHNPFDAAESSSQDVVHEMPEGRGSGRQNHRPYPGIPSPKSFDSEEHTPFQADGRRGSTSVHYDPWGNANDGGGGVPNQGPAGHQDPMMAVMGGGFSSQPTSSKFAFDFSNI